MGFVRLIIYRLYLVKKRFIVFASILSLLLTALAVFQNESTNTRKKDAIDRSEEVLLSQLFLGNIQKQKEAYIFFLDESLSITGQSGLNNQIQCLDHINNSHKCMGFPRSLVLSFLRSLGLRKGVDVGLIDFVVFTFSNTSETTFLGSELCLGTLSTDNIKELESQFEKTKLQDGAKTNIEAPFYYYYKKYIEPGEAECRGKLSPQNYGKVNIVFISDFDDDSKSSNLGSISHTLATFQSEVEVELHLVKLPDSKGNPERISKTLMAVKEGVNQNNEISINYREIDWSEFNLSVNLSDQFIRSIRPIEQLSKKFDLFYSNQGQGSKLKFKNDLDWAEELRISIPSMISSQELKLNFIYAEVHNVHFPECQEFDFSKDYLKQEILLTLNPGESVEMSIDEGTKFEAGTNRVDLDFFAREQAKSTRMQFGVNKVIIDHFTKPIIEYIELVIGFLGLMVIVGCIKVFTPKPIKCVFDAIHESPLSSTQFKRLHDILEEFSNSETRRVRVARDLWKQITILEKTLTNMEQKTKLLRIREKIKNRHGA